jgi:hypothetical protein
MRYIFHYVFSVSYILVFFYNKIKFDLGMERGVQE